MRPPCCAPWLSTLLGREHRDPPVEGIPGLGFCASKRPRKAFLLTSLFARGLTKFVLLHNVEHEASTSAKV